MSIKKNAAAATIVLACLVAVYTRVPTGLQFRPDISLKTIDGEVIDLGSAVENPMLVNFWATTCSICVHELPDMIALYDEYHQRGLTVVSIAMPYDPPNFVVDVSQRFSIPWSVALDINGDAMRAFDDVKATPTSFLFSATGNLVWKNTGKTDFVKLRQRLQPLLAKN